MRGYVMDLKLISTCKLFQDQLHERQIKDRALSQASISGVWSSDDRKLLPFFPCFPFFLAPIAPRGMDVVKRSPLVDPRP